MLISDEQNLFCFTLHCLEKIKNYCLLVDSAVAGMFFVKLWMDVSLGFHELKMSMIGDVFLKSFHLCMKLAKYRYPHVLKVKLFSSMLTDFFFASPSFTQDYNRSRYFHISPIFVNCLLFCYKFEMMSL